MLICIIRANYLDKLLSKKSVHYFGEGEEDETEEKEYVFGSLHDFFARLVRYLRIVLIIVFIHLPKIMLLVMALIFMVDPTILNAIMLIFYFVVIA